MVLSLGLSTRTARTIPGTTMSQPTFKEQSSSSTLLMTTMRLERTVARRQWPSWLSGLRTIQNRPSVRPGPRGRTSWQPSGRDRLVSIHSCRLHLYSFSNLLSPQALFPVISHQFLRQPKHQQLTQVPRRFPRASISVWIPVAVGTSQHANAVPSPFPCSRRQASPRTRTRAVGTRRCLMTSVTNAPGPATSIWTANCEACTVVGEYVGKETCTSVQNCTPTTAVNPPNPAAAQPFSDAPFGEPAQPFFRRSHVQQRHYRGWVTSRTRTMGRI